MTGTRYLVAAMVLGGMIMVGQNVALPRWSEVGGDSPPRDHGQDRGEPGWAGPGEGRHEYPHHRGQRRIEAPFVARWEEEHHEEDPLAEFEALERDEEVEAQAARVAGTNSREWILSPGADPTTTTGDAASIQAALDGAQTGDVITLTAGTYRVNLSFPRKMITLRGAPSATREQVILDGSGCVRGTTECSVITFDWSSPLGVGATAELRGITIQGGKGRKYSGSWSSSDTHGGGVWSKNGDMEIEEVSLSGNSATHDGGGMYLYSSSPTLSQVSLSGNSAYYYGGGMYLYSSSPSLSQVTISGNSASSQGGGMYLINSSPSLSQVSLTGNSAYYDGGGMYLYYSSPSLSQVSLSGNSATYYGGGMFLSSSSPSLSQVSLSGNSAYYDGGGMYLSTSSPTLSQVTISGNSASSQGGGMYLINSSPKLHNSIIAHNTAPNWATIYRHNSSSSYTPTFTNTLLYPVSGNALVNVTAPSAPFNQDPLFVDDPTDGTTSDDNYHLTSGSPARDVGATTGCYNPASGVFDLPCSDPDGSLPDLGAWGGPGADEWDLDGDGAPAPWWPVTSEGSASVASGYVMTSFDCNDKDDSIYPGAVETAYDSIDQDCDGLDSLDRDGDGYAGGPGGEDCDDDDPDRYFDTLCDGTNHGCDPEVITQNQDEGCRVDGSTHRCGGGGDTFTFDDDGDGYCESVAIDINPSGSGSGCPGGTYKSLQAAVNAVITGKCGQDPVIIVPPASWGTLTLSGGSGTLRLRSESGVASTSGSPNFACDTSTPTFTSSTSTPAILVESNYTGVATFKGLCLLGSPSYPYHRGGIVLAESLSEGLPGGQHLTFDSCLLRDGNLPEEEPAREGGAIYVESADKTNPGTLHLLNNLLIHNGQHDSDDQVKGGAVSIRGALSEIINNTFVDNEADFGAALYLYDLPIGPAVTAGIFSNTFRAGDPGRPFAEKSGVVHIDLKGATSPFKAPHILFANNLMSLDPEVALIPFGDTENEPEIRVTALYLSNSPAALSSPVSTNFFALYGNFIDSFAAAFGGQAEGCNDLPSSSNTCSYCNYIDTNAMSEATDVNLMGYDLPLQPPPQSSAGDGAFRQSEPGTASAPDFPPDAPTCAFQRSLEVWSGSYVLPTTDTLLTWRPGEDPSDQTGEWPDSGAFEINCGGDEECLTQLDIGCTLSGVGVCPWRGDIDADNDGEPASSDPDDLDATVYTGAPELEDGKDNNGNGWIDEVLVLTGTSTDKSECKKLYPTISTSKNSLTDTFALAATYSGPERKDIFLCPGTHSVPSQLNTGIRPVILHGTSPTPAVIEGKTQGLFLVPDGGDLQMESLVLTRGSGTNGGAVSVGNGARLYLRHVSLAENTATGNGGALYVTGGTLILEESTLTGNKAKEGGAIYVDGAANLSLVNTFLGWNSTTTTAVAGIYAEGAAPGAPRSLYLLHVTADQNGLNPTSPTLGGAGVQEMLLANTVISHEGSTSDLPAPANRPGTVTSDANEDRHYTGPTDELNCRVKQVTTDNVPGIATACQEGWRPGPYSDLLDFGKDQDGLRVATDYSGLARPADNTDDDIYLPEPGAWEAIVTAAEGTPPPSSTPAPGCGPEEIPADGIDNDCDGSVDETDGGGCDNSSGTADGPGTALLLVGWLRRQRRRGDLRRCRP